MSRIKYVGLEANAVMEPFFVGTMAMFEVMAPSSALSVAVGGCGSPSGHIVRKPNGPGGTTVALKTNACAVAGTPQGEAVTLTLKSEENGGVPCGLRESSTRQGVMA